MFTKTSFVCVVVCVCAGFVASALADDLNPPEWRGQDGTTYQRWEFLSSQKDYVQPEQDYVNPNGVPGENLYATVGYDQPIAPWYEVYEGRDGVWDPDWISFDIPNTRNPNDFKKIWLQLVFYCPAPEGTCDDPAIFTSPTMTGQATQIALTQIDETWWHGTYEILIMPNPDKETIVVDAPECTIIIDEVVIDTICAPEPATGLLLMPLVFFLRRRR